MLRLPRITPIRLAHHPEPFDRRDWLFELKWDGFRAVAYIETGAWRLISRKGNLFKSFASLPAAIADALASHDAILDGEIVALDAAGLRSSTRSCTAAPTRSSTPSIASGWMGATCAASLWWNASASCGAWCHASRHGCCTWATLTGAGWTCSARSAARTSKASSRNSGTACNDPDAPTWIKVKNRQYSQAVGRHERFEKMRTAC